MAFSPIRNSIFAGGLMSEFLHNGRRPVTVRERPYDLDTVGQIKRWIESFSSENLMVTLVKVEGGYRFHVHSSYTKPRTRCIRSEKGKECRVFKTVEAALNLARSFGFDQVRIEL